MNVQYPSTSSYSGRQSFPKKTALFTASRGFPPLAGAAAGRKGVVLTLTRRAAPLLATLALSFLPVPSSQAAAPARPNILFVLSDDQSYPFLSCYGDTNVRTPALDGLAAAGIKFHRFFTAAPQCVPSRASFLTGRSPVAARITRFSSPLPRDVITFPEILREKGGYYTGIAGRIYHLDGAAGNNAGVTTRELLEKHGLKTFADRVDYLRTGSDSQAIEQMREFLGQKPADKPFCLWLNFSDPHHPWTPEPKYRPDPASLKLPPHLPDSAGMREQLADFCGEVNRVDHSMQLVLDLLAERGFAENTLVVFAGDNGMAFPHGKGSLYDPGCNVPLVIRWPGVIKPGGDSRAMLSNEDLAPTLLAVAGLAPDPKMTGQSFLGLLKGETYTPRPHVFLERGPHGSVPVTVNMKNSGYDLSRAVRSDRYKFIYNCTPWIPYEPVDSMGGPAWRDIVAANEAGKLGSGLRATYFTAPRAVYELYDLDADPSELNNRSGDPALATIEQGLRVALTEKMITDFDYLPLPALGEGRAANTGKNGKADKNAKAKQ
ncbi:MAG: sulfatase [Opitutaceae bacterium]